MESHAPQCSSRIGEVVGAQPTSEMCVLTEETRKPGLMGEEDPRFPQRGLLIGPGLFRVIATFPKSASTDQDAFGSSQGRKLPEVLWPCLVPAWV